MASTRTSSRSVREEWACCGAGWIRLRSSSANGSRAAGKGPPGEQTVTEVGVAVPFGCMVPLAIAAAVLVGAGVLIGSQLSRPSTIAGPDHVVVPGIDDGAAGGPKMISTQLVPLR